MKKIYFFTLIATLIVLSGFFIQSVSAFTLQELLNIGKRKSTDYVYTINNNAKTLQKFKSSDLSLVTTASTTDSPYSLAVSLDGQYIYVTTYKATVTPTIGSVKKFRSSDLSLIASVNTGDNTFPGGITISSDGMYLYAVMNNGGTAGFVKKFKSADLTLLATGNTGWIQGAGKVVVSSDGKYVYVRAYYYRPDIATYYYDLEKYSGADLSFIARANSGNNCGGNILSISPDNNYLYTTTSAGCTDDQLGIQKYKTVDLSLVVRHISSPPMRPFAVDISSNNLYLYAPVYYFDQNGANHYYLEKYNTSDLNLVKQVTLGDTTHVGYSESISVSSNNAYLYVPYGASGSYLLGKFQSSDLNLVGTVDTNAGPSFVSGSRGRRPISKADEPVGKTNFFASLLSGLKTLFSR